MICEHCETEEDDNKIVGYCKFCYEMVCQWCDARFIEDTDVFHISCYEASEY